MENLNIKSMPLENPESDQLFILGKWIAVCVTTLVGFVTWLNKSFEDRKKTREAFMQAIVNKTIDDKLATYSASLDTKLNEMNKQIHDIAKDREDDRRYFSEKFDKIILELRK